MYQVKKAYKVSPIKTEATYDEQGNELTPVVLKTETEIAQEEADIKEAKRVEVQVKVDAYEAAKAHQLVNGGAGPVAEHEIMVICNEHSGQFEVVFK